LASRPTRSLPADTPMAVPNPKEVLCVFRVCVCIFIRAMQCVPWVPPSLHVLITNLFIYVHANIHM
jgi:hypothetical protein